MPTCWRCNWTGASSEIRRSSKGGVCKDKTACANRKRKNAEDSKAKA